MDTGAPALYLDPLLPLAVRSDPRAMPIAAGLTPARAILIATAGTYALTGAGRFQIDSPALLWCAMAPGTRLSARGDAAGWLVLLGQRLLDQLVVAAFGEPGFCRFLEGFASQGSAPSGAFGDDLPELLEQLRKEIDDRPPAYRVRARSLLTDVMLALYRATITADAHQMSGGFRVAAVIDYVELNYDSELHLEPLAELMETSPTHLSRVFRREVGIPLFEYINRTRVRKACALLRRTNLPVTRIALDVGYNNVSFFNRYFRRIMRCSPREYRRTVTE